MISGLFSFYFYHFSESMHTISNTEGSHSIHTYLMKIPPCIDYYTINIIKKQYIKWKKIAFEYYFEFLVIKWYLFIC